MNIKAGVNNIAVGRAAVNMQNQLFQANIQAAGAEHFVQAGPQQMRRLFPWNHIADKPKPETVTSVPAPPKPLMPWSASCNVMNTFASCSVPTLCNLYGGVDDCLIAVWRCIQEYHYPFVTWSDSVGNKVDKGKNLAELVVKEHLGRIIETPPHDGKHGLNCPIQIWIWDFASEKTWDKFLEYMASREKELRKVYQ